MNPEPEKQNSDSVKSRFKSTYCRGCYDDVYNHGCGGANECWGLKSAQEVRRKRVSIHQAPPWNQKPIKTLSCFHEPRYVMVDPERKN